MIVVVMIQTVCQINILDITKTQQNTAVNTTLMDGDSFLGEDDQKIKTNLGGTTEKDRIIIPGILPRDRIGLKDLMRETLHKNHDKIRGVLF